MLTSDILVEKLLVCQVIDMVEVAAPKGRPVGLLEGKQIGHLAVEHLPNLVQVSDSGRTALEELMESGTSPMRYV